LTPCQRSRVNLRIQIRLQRKDDQKGKQMSTIKIEDGVEIFYKD